VGRILLYNTTILHHQKATFRTSDYLFFDPSPSKETVKNASLKDQEKNCYEKYMYLSKQFHRKTTNFQSKA